jgi:hypothetical protein
MAEILQANTTHADDVYGIVQDTIKAICLAAHQMR